MRLHSPTQLSHFGHIWPMRTHYFSGWPIRGEGRGRGGECMPGLTLLLLSSLPHQSPGHSHSIARQMPTPPIYVVHSGILNLKMPGQWAHNWPSDGQNMALWTDVNTGDMTHGHHLSDGPWLARPVTVPGSHWMIIQVSHLCQCQGPSLLFAFWCSKALRKQQMLWFKMLNLISGDVVWRGRGLWEALFWIQSLGAMKLWSLILL